MIIVLQIVKQTTNYSVDVLNHRILDDYVNLKIRAMVWEKELQRELYS